MAKCTQCEAELLPFRYQCAECGTWNLEDAPIEAPTADAEAAATLAAADNSVTLDQVVSSSLDRIQTGAWDYCWGCNDSEDEASVYGIVRGSTTLIGGSPGAGKSTLMLQLCAAVAKRHARPGEEVLYIASEEQLKQIKQRATRLHIAETNLIRMVPAMSGGVDLNTLLRRYKPPLMVLDSLNGLVGEDDELAIKVCKIFKEFAMVFDCPGIIATHVTKDDVITGRLTLQHEVDTTMTFFPDLDRVGDNGEAVRVLEVLKNRNGRAFVSLEFSMTELGLVVRPPDLDEEDEEGEDYEEGEDE